MQGKEDIPLVLLLGSAASRSVTCTWCIGKIVAKVGDVEDTPDNRQARPVLELLAGALQEEWELLAEALLECRGCQHHTIHARIVVVAFAEG